MTTDLDVVLEEIEFRRCWPQTEDPDALYGAFVYWAEKYWHTKHPTKGRVLMTLSEAQKETIGVWLIERYTVCLKARQIGFSTLAGAYSFWLTFGWADRKVIFLSKGEREATKLQRDSVKYGLRALPDWMLRRGPKVIDNNQLKLSFSNESVIESMPSKNDPARGETVFLVVVDEWAYLENPEEAWASIEPITDVGGSVIGISTANGSGSFFEELWIGTETGHNSFRGLFFPWSTAAAVERDDSWYEKKKAAYRGREHLLHQEYPSNAEEAFLRSANAVFDLDKLKALASSVCDPHFYSLAFIAKDDWEWRRLESGDLKVWELPQSDALYVIGADFAEGQSEHADFTVAQVLKLTEGRAEQVACFHGHPDLDLFGEETLFALASWYNECLVIPENNSVGVLPIKSLQKQGYTRIYRTRRITTKTADMIEQYGFRTTQSTKPALIGDLNASLRDDELVIRDAETLAELKSYVRDGRKMQGSPHDDRTMAFALANVGRQHAYAEEYRPPKKSDKGSEAYWLRLVAAQHGGAKKSNVIGAHAVSKRGGSRRR